MAGRKIRDRADAESCLHAAAETGGPLRAWARAHGVDGRSLHAWRLNLGGRPVRPGRAGAVPSLRLVELVPSVPAASARYLVRVGGVEVEFGEGFQEDSLRRILAAVAGC